MYKGCSSSASTYGHMAGHNPEPSGNAGRMEKNMETTVFLGIPRGSIPPFYKKAQLPLDKTTVDGGNLAPP